MNRKIKNILLILILILAMSITLTGCNTEIPFKTFIIDSEVDIVEDAKIEGINLSKNETNQETVLRFQDVADTIFNQLGDKDFYRNNYDSPSNYNYILQNYLTGSFYKSIVSESIVNDFRTVMDNIYSKENTLFKKANVIEVGQSVDTYFYDVEIVSVDDEITFNTETIRFYTNKNFRIKSTKIIKKITKVQNTTTPLTSESLIPDTHSEALNKFDIFLEQMKNKVLFESINNNSNIGDADVQLESLISNISLQDKDTETLKNLYLMGKGMFDNKVLVSYRMDDTDKLATSVYTYAFSKGEKIEKFDFYYSRITNELTKVVQENK